MSGVGGGGRRKLSCERGQPMGYRTPLALVGKGRQGPRTHAHWMGKAIARSITRRARSGRLADEAREAMAALREVHHALRQREPLRPPPDNEPLIHGLCSPCSANGNRPVHRRTTNRSSMACALPASCSNGGWKDPQHVEGQLRCAGVRTRIA